MNLEDSAMPSNLLPCVIARFVADERGAITVDWTVMTAAVAGLGLASMGVVSAGSRTCRPISATTCPAMTGTCSTTG